MLNIPAPIWTLYNSDSVWKNFRVSFPNGEMDDLTNSDVVQESVRFTESICSRDVLKFGLTEASVIEFETVGVANMYGMMIECFCEIDISGLSTEDLNYVLMYPGDGKVITGTNPVYRIPYGVFRVESCPRNQEMMAHRKVTAYSLSYSTLSKSFPGFPTATIFDKLIIDPLALYSQVTEDNLESDDMTLAGAPPTYVGYTFHSGALFNRSRTRFSFSYATAASTGINPNIYYIDGAGLTNCDFIKVNLEYDKAAYEAAGMSIVNALNDAGYDLTCHAGGNTLYSSNEEALRDRYPEFFAPVIYVQGKTMVWEAGVGSSYPMAGPMWSQPIVNDKLIPVVGYSQSTDSRRYSFTGSGQPANVVRVDPIVVFSPSTITSVQLYNHSSGKEDARFDAVFPPVTVNYIKNYAVAEPSGVNVVITNKGTAKPFITRTWDSTTPIGVSRFSYVDAFDREAMLDGYLELNAMFGKINRQGKLQAIRLSTASPVLIQPQHYSSFWWDEFDVAPIGSVIFNYTENDESQTNVFTFGTGASVYDLTDNSVINSLADATLDSIQSLIRQRFVPHLLPIAFTPIELNMQGRPYLEDGDYLRVQAADGTLAYSFVMRHELSGIQFLEAEITSVSGQIIDSEVSL